MSYEVKSGNIFGRIGKGFGQGLAEQVPKEIERYRLSEGLKNLEQEGQNLTPFQQYSRLAAIPGITPQMIQSGAELLKHQGIRGAYAKKAGIGQREEQPTQQTSSQAFQDVKFANLSENKQQRAGGKVNEFSGINEFGQPQIVEKNPLRQEAQPRLPWSPERRDQEIAKIFEEQPNLTLPEAVNIASNNEQRFLAQPEAVQKQDEYLRKIQGEADNEFIKQLETKLQKTDEGVYKDITGEMINNLKRGIARDLRTKPNASVRDVVNDWTDKALNLAKTKSQLDELANRDLIDKITKQDQNLSKLKSYQKIFNETGNKEEFFNKLKSDFNLSPQGAASIAYPRNKSLSEYIKKIPTSKISDVNNFSANARKYAANIENLITADDSFLAIAREIRERTPFFDQRAFFDQLREDQDNLPLTARQKRELAEGESDILPNWGDIWLLPTFRGL